MKPSPLSNAGALVALLAIAGCNGSSSSSSSLPETAGTAQVRFIDGAPTLEALIGGVPSDIGLAYLRVNGQTVTYQFSYATITTFMPVSAGVQSLIARDTLGYAVGPLKSAALSANGRYTLVVVGAYPNYQVLTFAEPKSGSGAQLSLYEASPAMPSADFGGFAASSRSNFKKLGSATLGQVATVALGSSVSNFGGYVGNGVTPITGGTVTPVQVNGFDAKNLLPFQAATRLSLFLFDTKSGTTKGPVFGSLDK